MKQTEVDGTDRIRLSGFEVRALLRFLDIPGREAARLLCVAPGTIYRWQSEGCCGAARVLLLLLAAEPQLLNGIGGRWDPHMATEPDV